MAAASSDHYCSAYRNSCVKQPVLIKQRQLHPDVLVAYGKVKNGGGNDISESTDPKKPLKFNSYRDRKLKPEFSMDANVGFMDTDISRKNPSFLGNRNNIEDHNIDVLENLKRSLEIGGSEIFDDDQIARICEHIQHCKEDHQKKLRYIEKMYIDNSREHVRNSWNGTKPETGNNVASWLTGNYGMAGDSSWKQINTSAALNKSVSPSRTQAWVEHVMAPDYQERKLPGDALGKHLHVDNEQIKYMWNDFSVEMYSPKQLHNVSHKVKKTSSSPQCQNSTWSPKITVPKPFKMSIREECIPKQKSKEQLEIERKKLENEMAEKAETQKIFRARPPPAHIYIPLYKTIMTEQEERRKHSIENSKIVLKSKEKPFSFMQREQEKKRTKSLDNISKKGNETASPKIKAQPPPRHLFAKNTKDDREEQEMYRKIRKHMRALETMANSRGPTNYQRKLRTDTGHSSKCKPLKAIQMEPKFKPEVHDVPDFQRLHGNLQRQQLNTKHVHTTCKPFNLRTEKIRSRMDKVLQDIANDRESLPETRWPYRMSRTRQSSPSSPMLRSSSVDCIPTRTTRSADMRYEESRKRLEAETSDSNYQQPWKNKEKHREMKQYLAEKLAGSQTIPALHKTFEEKTKRNKESESALLKEYQKHLEEMMERVQSKPLLVERQAQLSAKKAAEKRFAETLRNAGVPEIVIQQHSFSSTPTTHKSTTDEGLLASREEANSDEDTMLRAKHVSYVSDYDDDVDDVRDDKEADESIGNDDYSTDETDTEDSTSD